MLTAYDPDPHACATRPPARSCRTADRTFLAQSLPYLLHRLQLRNTLDPCGGLGNDHHSGNSFLGDEMKLLLRRSQRTGGMLGGKTFFALDARVELSADENVLVRKYGLGKPAAYDSEARKKHSASAYGHSDNAAATPGYTASSAGRSMWSNARGLASAAMAALALHVTVDSLINGQHIECKDLDELLGAEAAITEACRNIKTYLETAVTFDGREELIEF
mgnify:FL=1